MTQGALVTGSAGVGANCARHWLNLQDIGRLTRCGQLDGLSGVIVNRTGCITGFMAGQTEGAHIKGGSRFSRRPTDCPAVSGISKGAVFIPVPEIKIIAGPVRAVAFSTQQLFSGIYRFNKVPRRSRCIIKDVDILHRRIPVMAVQASIDFAPVCICINGMRISGIDIPF